MGLNTTHNCWSGGYISFNIWRNKLAEVARYKMIIDDGKPALNIDWDEIVDENLNGDWENDPDDMLMILIVHCDNKGYIRTKHTKPLADRLAQLLPLMPDDKGPGHIGYWKEKTQAFIDGLLSAHEANEDVEFC